MCIVWNVNHLKSIYKIKSMKIMSSHVPAGRISWRDEWSLSTGGGTFIVALKVILFISCSFSQNLAKSYVGAPLEGWRPLLRGILDLPLIRLLFENHTKLKHVHFKMHQTLDGFVWTLYQYYNHNYLNEQIRDEYVRFKIQERSDGFSVRNFRFMM